MPLAMSRPVVLFGNSRVAPSGKVTATFIWGSAGLRFATLYWNPDAGAFLSGMAVSCGSLLRTSAGKRECSGIAGDSAAATGKRAGFRWPECAGRVRPAYAPSEVAALPFIV